MARVRAGGVIIRGDQILLMFRRKEGNEYWCFPGGKVEAGETAEQAVIREIAEETTVVVSVGQLLYQLHHDDGEEQNLYLCSYVSGEPSVHPNSPEAERMTRLGTYYNPQWIPLADLSKLLVYPLEARDWLIDDLSDNFTRCPRETMIRVVDLR
jgi:8-oxo-dGTP diphosphatase